MIDIDLIKQGLNPSSVRSFKKTNEYKDLFQSVITVFKTLRSFNTTFGMVSEDLIRTKYNSSKQMLLGVTKFSRFFD